MTTYLNSLACPKVDDDTAVVRTENFNIPLNHHNEHTKSGGTIRQGKYITHLKIKNEKFIPLNVFALKNLTHLHINNTCFFPCQNASIPREIECLTSLIELVIENTKITRLPKEIGKLKNLETLILSNTGLRNLPRSIGDLTSLNALTLTENNLKLLPPTMKNLQKLTKIYLSNNYQLHSIESLDNLPALDILNTNNCSIKRLPRNLTKLMDLRMNNNSLTELNYIQTLGNGTDYGKYFYFNMNKIKSVPPEIRQVKNLIELHLDGNQLTDLPKDIYGLSTLAKLFIQNNPFPPSISQTIKSSFHRENPKLILNITNSFQTT